ncbi:hypothetical protein TNCV_2629901 [Trichonephila clavipes]|uniref:Uncharacterized protein n=1 Tax=Trichonephila clavipes TaxID=2585209 RepID=A0A8X6SL22_TRICX|nr:hypothetical protein TNCV_2629901 [Trichonephila clavipes]
MGSIGPSAIQPGPCAQRLPFIPLPEVTSWKFCNARKGDTRLVPVPDYTVGVLKLPNQAPRVSGESLQTCVSWRCPDGTQHLFCWPILAVSGQSLASNGPVVDSRDMNLVFGHTEATHNKLFISNPTKYTVEPSWSLVVVWPPFELLHRALTTIVFTQYCSMRPLAKAS